MQFGTETAIQEECRRERQEWHARYHYANWEQEAEIIRLKNVSLKQTKTEIFMIVFLDHVCGDQRLDIELSLDNVRLPIKKFNEI